MKILISESKYEEVILKYLELNLYPDYGWASHQFYKEEVEKYYDVEFFINDESQYVYYLTFGTNRQKTLVIHGDTSNALNMLFGDKWVPIFKKWFEQNTGLEVESLVYYDNDNQVSYKNT